MQILKRIALKLFNRVRKAQNIIEFAFVFPMLIFLTLGIFEVAFFWQDVNAIYSLNTEINANVATIEPKGVAMGTTCPAAEKALSIMEARDGAIAASETSYNKVIDDGKEPFALYKYESSNHVGSEPQIRLWVDCRNPFENGVTTQLEFFHKTIIMKASIPRFDSPEPIVIIPSEIFIASPKLNSIRHY